MDINNKHFGSYQCCAVLYMKWNSNKSHGLARSTDSWHITQQNNTEGISSITRSDAVSGKRTLLGSYRDLGITWRTHSFINQLGFR